MSTAELDTVGVSVDTPPVEKGLSVRGVSKSYFGNTVLKKGTSGFRRDGAARKT